MGAAGDICSRILRRSTSTGLRDLGTLGRQNSFGTGINAAGQVTGYSGNAGDTAIRAFISTSTGLTNLGTLGETSSQGFGINITGQVTGTSLIPGDATQEPFVYNGTTLYNINALISPTSGWVLQEGNAINDSGQITGIGTIDGQYRAFLATPVVSPVPEPTSLAMLGVGLLETGAAVQRRRDAAP